MHKAESLKVAKIYAGTWKFGELADEQTGEIRFRLLKARFCRVRYCPICQWRRSLLWRAKFYQALPKILAEKPTARFIFLTLTVENCRVENLRETLQSMGKSWKRLIKRKEFSGILGWVRTTEVTREKARPGYAHPHFHCLLMVPSSYFKGGAYVKKTAWAEAWRGALRAEYTPVVDVRTVKPKEQKSVDVDASSLPRAGVIETLKYSVKPSDMTDAPEWFVTVTEQTHKLRFIATGGLFKDVLKAEERITEEEMVHLGEDAPRKELVRMIMRFLWEDSASGYFLEQARLPGLEEDTAAPST